MTEEEKVQAALEAKFKQVQDDLAKAQLEGAKKEDLEIAIKAIEKQGLALEAFMEAQKAKVLHTVESRFKEFLHENKDRIKEIHASGSGEIVFNPYEEKIVGDLTTGSGTLITAVPEVLAAQLGPHNFRNDNALLSLMKVTSTGVAAVSYTEMLPKEGDYDFVNEGVAKPQIDFRWETRHATPKKIAAYEILTEEAVTDYKRLQSIAKEYLRKKHDLFKVNKCFFGTGAGDEALGVTVASRTFVAGAMADKFALNETNIMDQINAVVTDIYTTQNYVDEEPNMPNLVMISPIDFFLNFQSAKDGNGLPLYPQASLFSTVSIGGLTIKPWIKIPAGKVFVGDLKKYNIVNYVPFSIRIGWINDQFITNKFTMLGESRYYQYIKNLDLSSFVYDDLATIKLALETI